MTLIEESPVMLDPPVGRKHHFIGEEGRLEESPKQ